MPDKNAQEQIISKLKNAENVLITVSKSPSVDELASALALTIALNNTDKYRATAVASGKMPDALEFLKPEKTFENSVDSLRDFIVVLNKNKADHLRFKQIGDHVKIFITPKRTTLTKEDLEFEQGDFNVDFVLALGVNDKENLDSALAVHGRIFHDATIGVITVGENPSSLSELNWHNPTASSLSESVLELIESDAIGKKSLSKSVATAILTGIVAETERFSNEKTTAKIMNIASKLIMAGADQQLVVAKLKEAEEKSGEISLNNEIENQAGEIEKSSLHIKDDEEIITNAEPEDNSAFTVSHDDPETELENSLENLKNTPIIETAIGDFSEKQDENDDIFSGKIPELPPQNFETQAVEIPQIEELPQIVPPVENYAPEIPQPVVSVPEQNFVNTTPAPAEEFQQAEAVEIQTPQISEPQIEASAPTFETPQVAEIPQNVEVAPISNQNFETPKTQGDEYYHPEQNRTFVGENLQTEQFLSHDASSASQNQEILPESSAYATAPTIQPLANQAPQASAAPAQDFGGFPPPPPVPDFSAMPMPPELPPVPDFNFTQNQQPSPEPALGTQASTNAIMTDQIYPQDPSQFRIPGM